MLKPTGSNLPLKFGASRKFLKSSENVESKVSAERLAKPLMKELGPPDPRC